MSGNRAPLRVPTRRRSGRLANRDYAAPGRYFVTVCARDHAPLFGELDGRAVHLSPIGRIVDDCWRAIPRHFPRVTLDTFVIMPDHMHGIIELGDRGTHASDAARGRRAPGLPEATVPLPRPAPGSLGAIMRSFKAAVSRAVGRVRGISSGQVWQRNYYERVIRDAAELRRMRWYILRNPTVAAVDRCSGQAPQRRRITVPRRELTWC